MVLSLTFPFLLVMSLFFFFPVSPSFTKRSCTIPTVNDWPSAGADLLREDLEPRERQPDVKTSARTRHAVPGCLALCQDLVLAQTAWEDPNKVPNCCKKWFSSLLVGWRPSLVGWRRVFLFKQRSCQKERRRKERSKVWRSSHQRITQSTSTDKTKDA